MSQAYVPRVAEVQLPTNLTEIVECPLPELIQGDVFRLREPDGQLVHEDWQLATSDAYLKDGVPTIDYRPYRP